MFRSSLRAYARGSCGIHVPIVSAFMHELDWKEGWKAPVCHLNCTIKYAL